MSAETALHGRPVIQSRNVRIVAVERLELKGEGVDLLARPAGGLGDLGRRLTGAQGFERRLEQRFEVSFAGDLLGGWADQKHDLAARLAGRQAEKDGCCTNDFPHAAHCPLAPA